MLNFNAMIFDLPWAKHHQATVVDAAASSLQAGCKEDFSLVTGVARGKEMSGNCGAVAQMF